MGVVSTACNNLTQILTRVSLMTSTNHELPSLPTAITNPTKYLNDPNYLISQKIDGRRLVAGVRDRKPFAYNRSGDSLALPPHLNETFKRRFPGSWLFDGELIDKDYYIFDVLEFPGGRLTNNPYSERLQLIESILSEGQIPVLHYVPSYGLNKHQFFERCQRDNYEGVVFKRINAPYSPGRTKSQLKFKFTHTVDCVVLATRSDDKDNLTLGLDDGTKMVEVGRVSALTGDGGKVTIGDVVEVTCLYVTEDDKLYQPTKPKLRQDKYPDECDILQLEDCRPNKSIIGV